MDGLTWTVTAYPAPVSASTSEIRPSQRRPGHSTCSAVGSPGTVLTEALTPPAAAVAGDMPVTRPVWSMNDTAIGSMSRLASGGKVALNVDGPSARAHPATASARSSATSDSGGRDRATLGV